MSSKKWKYAVGEKGETVTVYEREPGGPLYARALDPMLRGGKGGYRRLSLGHRDRDWAKTYAHEQAAKLRQGKDDLTHGKVTLARLVSEYLTHRSGRKSAGEQKADRRRGEMWARFLGARKDPYIGSLSASGKRLLMLAGLGQSMPVLFRYPWRSDALFVPGQWRRI